MTDASPTLPSAPCDVRTLRSVFRQLMSERLPLHWLDGWLLAVLDKPPVFLLAHDDYVLTADEMNALLAGIEQMQAGAPLDYVMGRQAFWGREFKVTADTLIPRPDSEIMIETVLDFIKECQRNTPDFTPCIVDLGTGTGCLAITLALELPSAQVLAVDLSAAALAVAQENGASLNADNCQFIQSDWFSHITGGFDVIISNPPYLADDDSHLTGLIAEPISALVADDAGLADIKRIIAGARTHLNAGGLLAIEHGYTQGQAVRKLMANARLTQVRTVQDYGGNERVTLGLYL